LRKWGVIMVTRVRPALWIVGLMAGLIGAIEVSQAAPRAAGRGALEGVMSGSTSYWLMGLVSGILLAVAVRTNWRTLPARLRLFVRAQRQRAGLAMLASVFLAVIILY
jgi:hypothetical protein